MNIHPDAIVVIMMAFGFLMGYIFGRIERKETYLEAYTRGKNVGKAMQVARNYSPYDENEVARNDR